MRSENQTYVPAVDHLRAYAALLIIFYHGNYLLTPVIATGQLFSSEPASTSNNPILAVLFEGHTAVALFMVLSGYIFTRGALANPEKIPYGKFMANRLLRIYPIYLLLVFLGAYTYIGEFDLGGFLQLILPMANFDGAANYGPISAMFWTVSVEFQFYLIFPMLFVFLKRGGLRWIAQLVVLMIALRWFAVEQGANAREISYWTLIGRLDQFLIGMALAYLLEKKTKLLSPLWVFPSSVVAMVAVLFLFHRNGGDGATETWRILWPPLEAAGWALVIGSYLSAAKTIPQAASKLISKFGTVSYSFYLLHFLVIVTLIENEWWLDLSSNDRVNAFVTTAFIALPVTTALAALSWTTVEKPFLQLRLSYSNSKANK